MTAAATFSLYIRPTPERPWFVATGMHGISDLLERFRYGPRELEYLRSIGIDEATLQWLGSLEPSGEVWAVPEGTVVLADEPIVEVTAPLPVAQLLETSVINLVHLPTLVATKAARVALAAHGRLVVDFGFRRAHGLDTGVQAALAAYIGGGLSTSNLEAGRRFGIPVVGTMAHSYVQAFPSELEAFRAFAEDHADNVILLVDTYDTIAGVRNAVVVADEMRPRGARLRAVRLDSGDLVVLAAAARRMLDDAGHSDVQIFASGGLDEARITDLVGRGAPIDAYGVGTDLVVSADRPAVDIAYKLVAYDGRPVAKLSPGKANLPAAKQIFRDGTPERDVLGLRNESLPGEPLLAPIWRDGKRASEFDLEAACARAGGSTSILPAEWKDPSYASDPPTPRLSDGLRDVAERVTGGYEEPG
jgi:nicotinate phosphoribosyltransferase